MKRETPGMWLGVLGVAIFAVSLPMTRLATGGALKVSQTQLLQPFMSILAAVPILGEPLEWVTLAFALAVMASVFLGKRFSAPPPVFSRTAKQSS